MPVKIHGREDLRENVSDIVAALRPSDALLATGSWISGLASSSAQLDLLLIGPGWTLGGAGRSASVAATSTATYELVSGRTVGIRFVTDDQLLVLGETISHLDQALFAPDVASGSLPMLDVSAQILLHEIRAGLVLANESIAEGWRQALRVEWLPTYLAALHLLKHAVRRENVRWHLKDGENQLALWTLRESLEELLAATLASVGETNPRKRWHLELLHRAEPQLGPAVVERLSSLLREWPTDEPGEHVGRALSFADSVISEILERRPELKGFVHTTRAGL